jgi:hypothetical protein
MAQIIASLEADREQLRVRLELRRSSASSKHRNRKRELKRPGKGNRKAWKQEV